MKLTDTILHWFTDAKGLVINIQLLHSFISALLLIPRRLLSIIMGGCCCLIISGCGGGGGGSKQDVDFGRGYDAGLVYAIPYNGQTDVSTNGRISLKLTDPVTDDDVTGGVSVKRLSTGESVSGQVSLSEDDGALLYFEPDDPLYAGEDYRVMLGGVNTSEGLVEAKDGLLDFKTKTVISEQFVVEKLMPLDPFPFVDFSTIYLTFSKSLNGKTVIKGQSFRFYEKDTNADVSGSIIFKDRNLSFDPDSDLEPGKTYVLSLTSDIKSVDNQSLPPLMQEFVPLSSHPRGSMTLNMTPTDREGDGKGLPLSPLTSAPVNTGRVSSQLLGDDNLIKFGGTFTAGLAYLANFPDVTPMVIRKGATIEASGFEIMLAGGVPAGLHSGNIRMTVLNDSMGYMVKSLFSNDRYASNNIILTLDAALEASDSTVNGMMTQNLMHTELVGTIAVEDGKLIIEAAGGAENTLMNITTATSNISWHFESVEDVSTILAAPVPTEPMNIKASYPSFGDEDVSPDNELEIYFSEVIESDSFVAGENVRLRAFPDGGAESYLVDFDMTIQGNSVKINPKAPLPFGTTFGVEIDTSVEDKHRNALSDDFSLLFSTPKFSLDDPKPGIVTSVFPGFPCAMINANFAEKKAGRCAGGKETDDVYNYFKMPSNNVISVWFSQPMDRSTISKSDQCNQGSFRVEKLDKFGNCVEAVAGNLEVNNQKLTFTPYQPWVVGQSYRYTLMSSDENIVCDEGEMCSMGNPPLPLNTDPLNFKPGVFGIGFHGDIGGIPMVIPFTATEPTRHVFAPLLTNPHVDINANGKLDDEETPLEVNYIPMVPTGTAGMVNSLSLGCDKNVECDAFKSRTFLNSIMLTHIKDYDPELDQMDVDVYPHMFTGTSVKMFAEALDGILKLQLDTGLVILRVREVDGGAVPATITPGGYDEFGKAKPAIFRIEVDIYMDTPYLKVLEGLSGTNFHSLEVHQILEGPVTFTEDGRMKLDLTNAEDIVLNGEMYALEKEALEAVLGENVFSQVADTVVSIFTQSPTHKIGDIQITVPKGSLHINGVGESPQ